MPLTAGRNDREAPSDGINDQEVTITVMFSGRGPAHR